MDEISSGGSSLRGTGWSILDSLLLLVILLLRLRVAFSAKTAACSRFLPAAIVASSSRREYTYAERRRNATDNEKYTDN
jgi:hypothetical protein